MAVIEVRNLSKHFRVLQKPPGFLGSLRSLVRRRYKKIKAVDRLSFTLKEGELVGFIGPNGAGKTTTLKLLTGLLYPTSGSVRVLGFNPWHRRPEYLKQIALIMGQRNQLWWDLPPLDTFLLNQKIYQIPQKQFKETLNELTTLLEIKDVLYTPTRKLSLGQRMKCELVASLLHRPKLLFLDEPTIGLDVVMQKKNRDFIDAYNRRFHATILLTSHYMEDVHSLCQRVIIINYGRLLFDGPLTQIIKRFANYKIIEAVFTNTVDPKPLEKIGQLVDYQFPKAVLKVKRGAVSLAAAELLQHFPISDLNITEPKIEDIIRQIFVRSSKKP